MPIESITQDTNDPRIRMGLSGQPITMGGPLQATDEQNQRVQMILQALQAGRAPMDVGVPHSEGLTPMPGTEPSAPGQTGQQFGLQGYQGAQGTGTPRDNKSALLEALRTRPQDTIRAMSSLAQQLKGIPEAQQKQIYEGLGMPQQPSFDPSTVGAAAAGVPVAGLSQQQGQQIQGYQDKRALEQERAKKRADMEEKANAPLTMQQMSQLYKYDPKLERVMPYTGSEILSARQAQQMGYRSVNPATITKATENTDAVNLQFTLLKGALEAAKNKSYPELTLSNASGGKWGGAEGTNLFAATRDFAFQWDRLIGGVRAAASPMFLAAMSQRLPSFWDEASVREQKIRLLEPAVRALQREKLQAVMGLPPDPKIKASMKAALQGMGLSPQLVTQFVDQSGPVPDAAPDSTELKVPVAPRPDNVVELNGKLFVREGPGRYRPYEGQ